MTRRELLDKLTDSCEAIYGRREAMQIARMILEEIGGISRHELLLHSNEQIDIENIDLIERELSAGRPVQYIIGEAEFCDFRIGVREGVLIPRPESEELLDWIIKEAKCDDEPRILDIGAGSGALSIALKRALTNSHVTAIEISEEAITIASENIAKLAPDVNILKGDALQGVEHFVESGFDIILSNPPYIPQQEKAQMRINVTKYEPHLALFVPDNDPLLFYRKIAESSLDLLNCGGKLYFEIHENFAPQMAEMLHQIGFQEVTTRLDINDKPRMICAQRG